MDLDVDKSRAGYYASSRLTKYYSTPNIMFLKLEAAIQLPSSTIGTNEVEDTDQTQCSGLLCETAEYLLCCDNGPDGKDEQGQTYKRRSFWKRTKKF
ncbi:unnamed protein product [Macrosiphum euphorbiae]|uniref:Uncharacterized protein n=1 Tax=Macrosiphum euphorbiae TaxID=13131 RepID=A0AAV0X8I2_9HEMI|nr:unnamed protein product [Macrosiphum euphorbiae]